MQSKEVVALDNDNDNATQHFLNIAFYHSVFSPSVFGVRGVRSLLRLVLEERTGRGSPELLSGTQPVEVGSR